MSNHEPKTGFYETVRRADLRKLDEVLDAVCIEWDRLAEDFVDAPVGRLESMEWAQGMQRVMASLRAAQASMEAMTQQRQRQLGPH